MRVTSYRDPLILTIDIAQDRSKALILWEMENAKKEIGQFAHAIPSLTRQQIVDILLELVELGLVARKIYKNEKPIRLEYALTNRGAQYLKCLRKMMNVGIEIMMDYDMNDFLVEEGYIVKIEEQDSEYLDIVEQKEI